MSTKKKANQRSSVTVLWMGHVGKFWDVWRPISIVVVSRIHLRHNAACRLFVCSTQLVTGSTQDTKHFFQHQAITDTCMDYELCRRNAILSNQITRGGFFYSIQVLSKRGRMLIEQS